ncbi:MAG: hypothetical protein ACREP9_18050 [Candidatus Dormibacteraceae bacterium]
MIPKPFVLNYRPAEVKSAAQVALEAGNSPQMIFEHYRELVTERAAKAVVWNYAGDG